MNKIIGSGLLDTNGELVSPNNGENEISVRIPYYKKEKRKKTFRSVFFLFPVIDCSIQLAIGGTLGSFMRVALRQCCAGPP
jgi:hypothetical protein